MYPKGHFFSGFIRKNLQNMKKCSRILKDIIKTEYRDKIGVEQSKAEHLTNNESEINNMLNILKENEVTPIGLEDVIIEIKKLQALAKNKKLSYNT